MTGNSILRRTVATVVLLVAIVLPASAQEAGDYEAGFERDVNRYRWTAGLNWDGTIGSWRMAMTEQFRSDAFLLFDDRLSFRDENAVGISLMKPLSNRALLQVEGRSDWFSLSRVLSQYLVTGIAIRASEGITLHPYAGVAMDRRPGVRPPEGAVPLRTDIGPAVGLRLDVLQRLVAGYSLKASGSGFWHRIEPRRSGGMGLDLSAERTFESTRVRTELRTASVRRDAYQAASFLNRDETLSRSAEAIESTRSDTLDAALMVSAPIGQSLRLDGRVALATNNRSVRSLRAPAGALFFDSDFRRRAGEVEVAAAWSRDGREVRLAGQGGAETERRTLTNEAELPGPQASQKRDLLRQADYDRGYVTLRLDIRLPLRKGIVFHADASVNGIRHDTPIINPDDRDEVFYSTRTGLLLRPDPAFDVDLQLFASHYHTVYLKSIRSAENNVQRSLRFRPTFRWRPSRSTRIELASEVRATYTVDDFVLPGRRPTDQAARELRYDLRFEHDASDDLRILVDARTSDLRLGRFLNDVFAEIPFDTLRTHGGWLRLQTGQRVQAELGLRVFIRTDYDRSATVKYDRVGVDGSPMLDAEGEPVRSSVTRPGRERIAQLGPTTAVVWPLRGGASLRFDGWLTFQRITRALYGDLPEGSEEAIRRAADRGQRTLIPNLSVTARWMF